MKKSLLMVVLSILIWQPSFAKLDCDEKNYLQYNLKRGRVVKIYECIDLDKNNACYLVYQYDGVGISCVKLD